MSSVFGPAHWLRRPSTWLPVLGLVLLLVPLGNLTAGGYGQAAIARSTTAFFVVVPACTAAIAWEASRFRPLGPLSASSLTKIFVSRAGAFIFGPLAGLWVALAFLLPGSSGLSASTLLVFCLYSLVTGLAWAVIGFSLGRSLRPAFSLLVALGLPYAWYAMTPALPPGRLRAVTGDMTGCCSLETVVDNRALVTATVGVAALSCLVVGCGILAQRKRKHAGAVILVIAVFLGAFAWHLSAGVETTAGKARSVSEQECADGVCAWPEVPADNRKLNVQALSEFQRLAPREMAQKGQAGVVWDSTAKDRLIFSGAESLDGVLGDFVDQSAADYLADTGQLLCGVDPRTLGLVRTMQPWPRTEPVTPEAVRERLQDNLCPHEHG